MRIQSIEMDHGDELSINFKDVHDPFREVQIFFNEHGQITVRDGDRTLVVWETKT